MKKQPSQRKIPLLPILFTVFIDLVGVGIVIPTLGPLFLSSGNIFPSSVPFNIRAILLGLLIASYPLAQFFGAPMIGAFSDRVGRKKMLLLSLAGTFIAYIVFGIGIIASSLLVLFLSRIVDGFTGGNISIALSAISDISDEKEKVKNFGLVGMVFGLGFVLGPYLGGVLADPHIVSWFNNTVPYFFASILCFINIILVIFMFPETLKSSFQRPISLLTGFKNIKKALEMPNLRTMFVVIFLFTFGFNFFTQFFQVFLIEKFHYSQSAIGNLFGYLGLWIALAQGFVTRAMAKRYSPQQTLSISMLLLAISIAFLVVPSRSVYLYLIFPFIAVFNGLTQPNSTAIVSSLADASSQGEILGINQSIQALGMAIPPLISGFIVTLGIGLPIIISSATVILAWLVFINCYNNKNRCYFIGL